MRGQRVLACLLAMTAASTARAGNDDTYFMSAQAAIVGGAVVASTDGAGSVWYNPAGLGHVQRHQLDLSLTVAAWQKRGIDGGLATTLDGRELTAELNGSRATVVSPSTAYVLRIGKLTVGGGAFVSRDDVSDMVGDDSAQSGDLSALSHAALATNETRYHFGGGAGFALSERLRLGFAVFGIYDAFDTDLSFALHLDDAEASERSFSALIDERDRTARYGLEINAGLQADLHEHVTAGVLVRSPIILLDERLNVQDVLNVSLNDAPDTFMIDRRPRKEASAGLLEPARVVLALSVAYESWGASVEADWAHALRSQDLSLDGDEPEYLVDRNALWNVRAGARWDATDTLRLGAGFFTDRSPKKTSRFVNDFDVDYYGVSAGAIFTQRVGLAAKEREQDLLFRTSVSVRYAVGIGEVAQVEFAPEALTIDTSETVDVLFHELYVMVGSGLNF